VVKIKNYENEIHIARGGPRFIPPKNFVNPNTTPEFNVVNALLTTIYKTNIFRSEIRMEVKVLLRSGDETLIENDL